MQSSRRASPRLHVLTHRRPGALELPCTVGMLTAVDAEGHPLVDWPGNAQGPVPARTVADPTATPAAGMPVLLVFADDDPTAPVIVGFPRDTVRAPAVTRSIAHVDSIQTIVANVASFTLEADREIVLRAGEASITVRADGTVVVKGVKLVSRASETNRIKGAAVKIN